MRHLEIRKARSTDVAAIKAVEVACGLSPWSAASYLGEVGRLDSILLIATVDDSVVGFVAGRNPLDPGTEAEINNIGVLAEFRSRGLGHELLTAFRDLCTKRGTTAIWLEVRASNSRAISFYRSHGFTKRGVRSKFYRDPTEDAELMSLDVSESPAIDNEVKVLEK